MKMSFNNVLWILLLLFMTSCRLSVEIPHFRQHTNSTINQNVRFRSRAFLTSNQNTPFRSRANSSTNEMHDFKQQRQNETSPICGNGKASCNLYIRRMIYFYKVVSLKLLKPFTPRCFHYQKFNVIFSVQYDRFSASLIYSNFYAQVGIVV